MCNIDRSNTARGGIFMRKTICNKYNFNSEFDNKKIKMTPSFLMNPRGMVVMNKIMDMMKVPLVDSISRTSRFIKGKDGKNIKLYIYENESDGDITKPVLLYIHGGAFYLDYISSYHTIASNYAKLADCKVVSVCYRTLVTSTYQTCLDDCYQALRWIYDNAELFHWDKNKIAVAGDSAGGNLSGALVHLSRDLNGPNIAYQMLLYPCTTTKEDQQSMLDFTDTPGWNSALHHKIFSYIRPSLNDNMRKYFNLTDMSNFEGICDAYIEVEEFDCLRDQGKEYASLLRENGCTVSLNDVKGTFHAFDQDQSLNITKSIMKTRCDRLRASWGTEERNKEEVL